ncbi:FkbM family methyltransferase [Methylobacterium terricola]|uniref:FkbM family methyltransferase n=1 Tax=Methylobacterium terricola TaxID=2583531 RepID=UPI0014864BF1|nr:FkbM family methyltransferase [Methylobacterium terricola]
MIVADETNGNVNVPPDITKIIIDHEFNTRNGLYITERIFWRCGDYFLIAAYKAFQNADFFWLLDDDTRINSENLDVFFSKFESSGYDFLAAEFQTCGDYWSWTQTVKWYTDNVYSCFFPITFYSSKAADTIYKNRKQLTEVMNARNISPDMWPNDEAFTASAVVQAGLKAADFNQIQQNCILKENFHFGDMPMAEQEFKKILPNEQVYHPVLSGLAYYKKLLQSSEQIFRSLPKADDINNIFERIFSNIDKNEFPDEHAYLMQRRDLELKARQEGFFQGTAECVQTGHIYKISFQVGNSNNAEVLFFVDNPLDYIEAYATRGSFYEKECLLMIKDLLPSGGSFLDVGAYNGNHSVYVGFALTAKNIFVCEANPHMAKVCATNMCLNRLHDKADLRGLGVALSNARGKAKIHAPSGNAGSAALHSFNANNSDIPVMRGDELYKDCAIDVMKIDVGDCIIDVLHGFSGILATSKPAIIAQYTDNHHNEILEFLSQFGYKVLNSTSPYHGQKISAYST